MQNVSQENAFQKAREIKIEPVFAQITNADKSTKVCMYCIGCNLMNLATFYYEFRSDKDEVQLNGNFILANEEYDNWGSDDAYPLNAMLASLNMAIKIVE